MRVSNTILAHWGASRSLFLHHGDHYQLVLSSGTPGITSRSPRLGWCWTRAQAHTVSIICIARRLALQLLPMHQSFMSSSSVTRRSDNTQLDAPYPAPQADGCFSSDTEVSSIHSIGQQGSSQEQLIVAVSSIHCDAESRSCAFQLHWFISSASTPPLSLSDMVRSPNQLRHYDHVHHPGSSLNSRGCNTSSRDEEGSNNSTPAESQRPITPRTCRAAKP